MLLFTLTIVGAGVSGFLLHRLSVPRLRARWHDGSDPEGLTTADIIRPLQALVVLLLALVLFHSVAILIGRWPR